MELIVTTLALLTVSVSVLPLSFISSSCLIQLNDNPGVEEVDVCQRHLDNCFFSPWVFEVKLAYVVSTLCRFHYLEGMLMLKCPQQGKGNFSE